MQGVAQALEKQNVQVYRGVGWWAPNGGPGGWQFLDCGTGSDWAHAYTGMAKQETEAFSAPRAHECTHRDVVQQSPVTVLGDCLAPVQSDPPVSSDSFFTTPALHRQACSSGDSLLCHISGGLASLDVHSQKQRVH